MGNVSTRLQTEYQVVSSIIRSSILAEDYHVKHTHPDRRALISGLGVAIAGAALGATPARAQSPGPFTPARHADDAWLGTLPGQHRVFIDSASAASVSDALAYASNLFTANKNGYGLDDKDIATVVCLRHFGTVFGYNNAMWEKYGAALAKSAEYVNARSDALNTNPHAAGRGGIDALAGRGVHFAICQLASRRIAGQVAKAVGGDTDAILKELLANGVPNGHFMAAGVLATTRAQEYGYSLLVAV